MTDEERIYLVNTAKERMTTRTQELLDTLFLSPEEIERTREIYRIASEKAHEAAVKAGVKLHPRIAALKNNA